MYVRKKMHRICQCIYCNGIINNVGMKKVSSSPAQGCRVAMVFQVVELNSNNLKVNVWSPAKQYLHL